MSHDYNGYANRATWAVCLNFMNDEGLYHMVRAWQNMSAARAEDFVRDTVEYCNMDMLDFTINDLDDVNWDEVAEAFNEE